MSTPTIPEQGEHTAKDAPSPERADTRSEQIATPGVLARLAANPKAAAGRRGDPDRRSSAPRSPARGAWPHGWTVDVKSPLNDLDNWLVDNRETHPLFLYFLLHISNFAETSVDAIISLFDSMGWIGVTVVGTLIAWASGGADLSRRALRTGATAWASSSSAACWACGRPRCRRWR